MSTLPRAHGPDREVIEKMVAEPDRVEAHGLCRSRHGNELRERHFPFDLGHLYANRKWTHGPIV